VFAVSRALKRSRSNHYRSKRPQLQPFFRERYVKLFASPKGGI
jgi:hypothetical protein